MTLNVARGLRAMGVAVAFFALALPTAAGVDFSIGRQGGSQYPLPVALAQALEKPPGIGARVAFVEPFMFDDSRLC